jgi:hypothetical protein
MRRDSDSVRRAQGLGLRAVGAAALVAVLSAQPSALGKLQAFSAQPSALLRAQSQPSSPIIVKIIQPEPKSDLEGLSDVLLGSLGLTGVITLAALLLGAVLAAVMFWFRSRSV